MINTKNLLTIKVTKTFENSTVSKILELVENTSSKKAKTENFITKFAKIYTPIVIIIAIIIAIVPPLIIKDAFFSDWFYKALVCLVISCPCALVISVPLGYFAGIGCASKNGILVKGSNYLEALNNVDTIVFDKTGTLTRGVFEVTEIHPLDNISEAELLENCAYAESFSNHPIASSILNKYGKEIDKSYITLHEEIAGNGIKAIIKGKEVLAGNKKLLEKEKIDYEEVEKIGTVIYVAIDRKFVGYIVISDVMKEDTKKALKDLRKLGITKEIMLTGDTKAVASKIAKELEIDEFKAELLPDAKVEEIEKIMKEKTKGKLTAFVGDRN